PARQSRRPGRPHEGPGLRGLHRLCQALTAHPGREGTTMATLDAPADFPRRHIGPGDAELQEVLRLLELNSLEDLVAETVPKAIRLGRALDLPAAASEASCLEELERLAAKNEVWRSYLGMGYADCRTPNV